MRKLIFGSLLLFALLFTACSSKNSNGSIEASGTLEAKYVTVSAKTAGEVKWLSLEEGDKVKQGDTLAIIDREGFEIQVRNMEAALSLAEAQYALLQNGSRKEDLGMAKAQLQQAQASFDMALKDKNRNETLFASQAITKKQMEDVQLKFELAEQQLKSAQDNNMKIRNIARPEELQQAKARVDQSRAALDADKKQLRDATLICPITGIVVKKYVEQGETVSLLSNLVKVSDLSKMEMMLYVSETELGRVKLGADVDVKIDSFKDRSFKGKVVFISPEAEFTPKNIQTKDERTKLVFGVKVEIPNPGMELKAGIPADAIIGI